MKNYSASLPARKSSPGRRFLLAGVGFASLALSLSAQAQLPKIFVASFGNDANDGTRNSPKRNFQAAHNAVAANGEIVVLDTAGYGAVLITKSVGITAPAGITGFVTAPSSDGIVIEAGATDTVILRGLTVERNTSTATAVAIRVLSVGALTLEDCALRNFADGLFFRPNNSARLVLHDTSVRGCTVGLDLGTFGAAVTYSVLVSRCRLEGNLNGLVSQADTNGVIDLTANGCTINGASIGVISGGAGSTVRLSDCTITGSSSTGVGTNQGGVVLSRGNNTLERNASGNTLSNTYSAK